MQLPDHRRQLLTPSLVHTHHGPRPSASRRPVPTRLSPQHTKKPDISGPQRRPDLSGIEPVRQPGSPLRGAQSSRGQLSTRPPRRRLDGPHPFAAGPRKATKLADQGHQQTRNGKPGGRRPLSRSQSSTHSPRQHAGRPHPIAPHRISTVSSSFSPRPWPLGAGSLGRPAPSP